MQDVNDFNKWTMRFIAIVVSVLLFLFVSYENSRTVNSSKPGNHASVTSEEILEDVPIKINVDSEQYYVSGIPQVAQLKLEGPQSVLTQFLATTNIQAETPDLNQLGLGDHSIRLTIADLPDRLSASFIPERIDINIEKRVSQELPIELDFDSSLVAEGFQVGTSQLSRERAVVSGRQSEMAKVDRLAVVIPADAAPYSENIQANFPVLALDSQGELLDLSVDPAEVNVNIPILGAEKTVPIRLESQGGQDELRYNLSIASDQMKEVTLRGPQSVLNDISSIPVVVNLDGISNSTSRTIDLQAPAGIAEMSMDSITVVINVAPEKNQSDQASSSSEESNPKEDPIDDSDEKEEAEVGEDESAKAGSEHTENQS